MGMNNLKGFSSRLSEFRLNQPNADMNQMKYHGDE